ncbi:hypothetical protein D4764_02G0000880 [Takifugu flavidus]|uniref:Uncharacterized protein n=1 Tax=Takifugu flavidus TaxID=433684 RepID=A0A5C6NN19_9TELE|nr:hypothetical protein D4764_02G0000880 [Takifugu flavidus]
MHNCLEVLLWDGCGWKQQSNLVYKNLNWVHPNSEGAAWTQLEFWILPSNVPIRTANTAENKNIQHDQDQDRDHRDAFHALKHTEAGPGRVRGCCPLQAERGGKEGGEGRGGEVGTRSATGVREPGSEQHIAFTFIFLLDSSHHLDPRWRTAPVSTWDPNNAEVVQPPSLLFSLTLLKHQDLVEDTPPARLRASTSLFCAITSAGSEESWAAWTDRTSL